MKDEKVVEHVFGSRDAVRRAGGLRRHTERAGTPASGAQSASAAGDSNVNAEGFPIVNEPITLRGMVALNANVKDWNEHPALKRMEELTGIHIEWECVPDAGFTEKRNLAFASDDLPDIILRAKISPQEEMKYAANGQLVALDEYLDYAPNLSALIEQDDAIRKGIAMPDGHIYSCPQLEQDRGQPDPPLLDQQNLAGQPGPGSA